MLNQGILSSVHKLYKILVCNVLFLFRWVHINVIRIGFGQAKFAKLTDIQILYKSQHFVVVNKKQDIKINSDSSYDYVTVATQLKYLYPECVDASVSHGFRFVHRLDYATSGVLCVALTKKGAQWGNKAFQDRRVTKHYLALVRGHMIPGKNGQRDVTLGIGVDSSVTDVHKMCVETHPVCVASRSAHTSVYVLQHGAYDSKPASKVLLIPHTGRTHQLRVHCQHLGHLIVGDYTYSDRRDVSPYRMMLHACLLTIPCKEPINIRAADPFIPEVDPLWKPTQTLQAYDPDMDYHSVTKR